MTDYKEEQEGELETLRCIYTDEELTEVSEDPLSFQIIISSEGTETDDCSVNVVVQFSLPETYPDVAPLTEVVSQSHLTAEQVQEIETLLQEQAGENLGMVMVFTLVSAVQEHLGQLIEDLKKEREREKERKEEEKKKIEEAKFHGTAVTMESFLEWRQRFEREMTELTGKSKAETSQPPRLTGRQMFERDASLALSDARFLAEAQRLVDLELQEEEVEVDESLFQDLEDLELKENQQS